MANPAVAALGYVELGVSDVQAWRSYAQDVLGADCESAGEALHVRIDESRWRLRIVAGEQDDLLCAGFEVASQAVLEALAERLAAHGFAAAAADAERCASRGVDALLLCEDPDGLPLELYVGKRASSAPFASPVGVGGFVTGAQGLGHMVIGSAEPERAASFYREVLGFRLSDYIVAGRPGRQAKLTFLHCNARHHTLAITPAGRKRLHHIMLQVADVDDVGRGLDRAVEAGCRISNGLGRHTNDRMLSFYMRTPSGFDIEYGFGGIEIDDAAWEPETYDRTSIWGHRRG